MEFDDIVVFFVSSEGEIAGFVNVGLDSCPPYSVVNGLEFLSFRPVPYLNILSESHANGDEVLRFREDGVRSNEIVARPGLYLYVKGDFDSR